MSYDGVMLKLLTATIVGAGCALATAAPALADTDSIASWGDKNLGGSVGTTGGSASLGGYTTTVDGFGTLHGATTLVGPGVDAGIVQSYDNGFQSTTHVNDFSQTTEVYYDGTAEWEYKTPNGSIALVCTPTKGCTTE